MPKSNSACAGRKTAIGLCTVSLRFGIRQLRLPFVRGTMAVPSRRLLSAPVYLCTDARPCRIPRVKTSNYTQFNSSRVSALTICSHRLVQRRKAMSGCRSWTLELQTGFFTVLNPADHHVIFLRLKTIFDCCEIEKKMSAVIFFKYKQENWFQKRYKLHPH